MCMRGLRHTRIRGFSLIELVFCICILALLISMIVPALRAMIQESRRNKCLSQVRQAGIAVILYGGDSRGSFPLDVSDAPASLQSPNDKARYRLHATYSTSSGALVESGYFDPVASSARCPTSQSVEFFGTPWSDYRISTSAYIRPEFLDPLLAGSPSPNDLGARIQNQDSVQFPSDKAGLYESKVWHAFSYRFTKADNLSLLQPDFVSDRISIFFMDGHGEQLPSVALQAGVARPGSWSGVRLSFTPLGMRGRDRK